MNGAALAPAQEAALAEHAPFPLRVPDPSKIRPVQWLWDDRVPLGALSLVIGEESIGKGLLTAWLLARVTRGELPGDRRGRPGMVIVVGDEDGFDDVWLPRLLAAGADLDYVRELPASDDLGALNVQRDHRALAARVTESGASVVYFDALLDNLPIGASENYAKPVRDAIAPLRRIARQHGFAALATLHTNKARGGSFRERAAGSHAFNALSRSSLLIAAHPEDRALPEEQRRRVIARGKGNLSARPATLTYRVAVRELQAGDHRLKVPVLDDLEESPLSLEELLERPDDRAGRVSERDRAASFLRDALAGGPLSAAAVRVQAEEAGIAWRTVERASTGADAVVPVEKYRDGAGWAWRLKPATEPLPPGGGDVGGHGGLEAGA